MCLSHSVMYLDISALNQKLWSWSFLSIIIQKLCRWGSAYTVQLSCQFQVVNLEGGGHKPGWVRTRWWRIEACEPGKREKSKAVSEVQRYTRWTEAGYTYDGKMLRSGRGRGWELWLKSVHRWTASVHHIDEAAEAQGDREWHRSHSDKGE